MQALSNNERKNMQKGQRLEIQHKMSRVAVSLHLLCVEPILAHGIDRQRKGVTYDTVLKQRSQLFRNFACNITGPWTTTSFVSVRDAIDVISE